MSTGQAQLPAGSGHGPTPEAIMQLGTAADR
jgi:hypothetical protein